MNDLEIINGNKLIADFMGLSYCTKYQYEGLYKNYEHNDRICNYNELKYHSDWNWLIEVVKKIEELNNNIYQVDILQEGCKISIRCKQFIDKTVSKLPDNTTKINAVWLAIVEFIKWYNENLRMKKTYKVVWEIELDAENELEAAKTALNWLNEAGEGKVFIVQEENNTVEKPIYLVNLLEEDEDAVLPMGQYKPLISNSF